jgi:hypothetical protein
MLKLFPLMHPSQQKTDLIEHPEVIDHVGLLVNEPSAVADCSLSSHPNTARLPQPHHTLMQAEYKAHIRLHLRFPI